MTSYLPVDAPTILMVDTQAIVMALTDYAEELEAAQTGTGATYLKDLRDKALASISAGQSTTLISSTVNGQSFSHHLDLSAVDMLAITTQALRELNGDAPGISYPRWNNIPH